MPGAAACPPLRRHPSGMHLPTVVATVPTWIRVKTMSCGLAIGCEVCDKLGNLNLRLQSRGGGGGSPPLSADSGLGGILQTIPLFNKNGVFRKKMVGQKMTMQRCSYDLKMVYARNIL